ncbi:SAM-dependent chlorinase/fluorinase [unidentified bacterial endosymbiont]|uniref:SAM-dependent chlorinase/fluorinase n=1 Tax=unidentified bacterial endosymbiont TaxID=2355 RepID=UPI00209F6792|nr:SAM-dependent chlorinase/fluorinase [unidentified bacterial endosymbiont]
MGDQNQPIRQVVIITDCIDIAFNEMHQELKNLISEKRMRSLQIAPMAKVKNFSVTNSSFVIRLLADSYPAKETLFVVVVSGLGTNPSRIFGCTKQGLRFVGNNSGYFHWLIQDFGLQAIYKNNTCRRVNGKSFGGKYVQIPTAVKLIEGTPMDELGQRMSPDFMESLPIADGTVVHVDNFGLMKIKAPPLNFQEGQRLHLSVNSSQDLVAIYSEKMKRQKDGEWVLFPGSSLDGLPELGKVRSQNSAQELGITEGDLLRWTPVIPSRT